MQFAGSVGADEEIWYGKVTSTGSSTVTFTWSASVTGHTEEYGAEEFHRRVGGVDGMGPRQDRHHQRRFVDIGAVPEPHPERIR